MAVTFTETKDPEFPFVVSSPCRSWAEAQAKADRIMSVNADAFLPTPKQVYEENFARKLAEDRPLVTDVFVQREHAAGGFMFAPERD